MPSTQAGTTSFGKFDATGSLGAACAPFDPSGGGATAKRHAVSRSRWHAWTIAAAY